MREFRNWVSAPRCDFRHPEREKMRWPLEDEIRWIEWRLLELVRGEPCSAPLTALDCRVWLAHKRSGKSYAEIARSEYPQFWDANKGKRGKNQKIISLVRRTVNRVEQYMIHPTRHWKSSEIEEFAQLIRTCSFGVVPIFVETNLPAFGETRAQPKPRSRKEFKSPALPSGKKLDRPTDGD